MHSCQLRFPSAHTQCTDKTLERPFSHRIIARMPLIDIHCGTRVPPGTACLWDASRGIRSQFMCTERNRTANRITRAARFLEPSGRARAAACSDLAREFARNCAIFSLSLSLSLSPFFRRHLWRRVSSVQRDGRVPSRGGRHYFPLFSTFPRVEEREECLEIIFASQPFRNVTRRDARSACCERNRLCNSFRARIRGISDGIRRARDRAIKLWKIT